MSTKFILAALGMAFVRAGEVLVEYSQNWNDEDGTLSETPDTPAQQSAAQVTPGQIANAPVDAEGLPWDARIHAATKTKTQKGTWTKKKKVDEAVFNSVLAELRQQYPEPQQAQQTTPTSTPTPTQPQLPTLPGGINVPNITPKTPYTELVDWMAKNTGAGKALTDEWVQQVFAGNNTTLADLAAPDKHPMAAEFLKAFRGALTQLGVQEVA